MKKTTLKMMAASARLDNLTMTRLLTPLHAHREMYIAKIRSLALYGAEVWGVENCSILDTEEPKLLRQLCRCCRRPLTNMVRYYLKLETLDDIATRRAFGFWCATKTWR